jgi:hypothetical protein
VKIGGRNFFIASWSLVGTSTGARVEWGHAGRCVRSRTIFPHKISQDFLQYIPERPKMTSYGEKSKEAKTRKGKLVYEKSKR